MPHPWFYFVAIFPLNLSQLIIFTWCLLPRELEAESWVLLLLFRANRPELRMRFAQNLESVDFDPQWVAIHWILLRIQRGIEWKWIPQWIRFGEPGISVYGSVVGCTGEHSWYVVGSIPCFVRLVCDACVDSCIST